MQQLCTISVVFCCLLWFGISRIYPYSLVVHSFVLGEFRWVIAIKTLLQWASISVSAHGPSSGFVFQIQCMFCCAMLCYIGPRHYTDVIMGTIASQITSLTIVYSTVHSGADQRKHQSSASLAFVRGIHRWPGNSPHKGPVTRKMFPFDDVIM